VNAGALAPELEGRIFIGLCEDASGAIDGVRFAFTFEILGRLDVFIGVEEITPKVNHRILSSRLSAMDRILDEEEPIASF
jgi:hypothetical protein